MTGLRKLLEAAIPPRAASFKIIRKLVAGKIGFEIGGPSRVFSDQGLLPIYRLAARVDNCNFSSGTIWEGSLREGEIFRSGKGPIMGYQYIREATDLHGIPSRKYDFVCSAYTIQHSANPLKGLFEWLRILKEDGILVLLIPHRAMTFDHRRPVTTLAHLIDDHREEKGEDDTTHIGEVLSLHDLTRDVPAGSFDDFKKRTLQNSKNRAVHQHVFDPKLAVEMLDHVGLGVRMLEVLPIDNIILVARKMPSGVKADNSMMIARANEVPFGESAQ